MIEIFWNQLANIENWTLANIFAGIGAVVASLAFFGGIARFLFTLLRTLRSRTLLKKNTSRTFFDHETIQRARQNYVFPDCAEADPTQGTELRDVVVNRSPLFVEVEKFLQPNRQEEDIRHLLILADSGMGKTVFILNYFAKHYLTLQKEGKRLEIMPLGMPGVDEKVDQIENKEKTFLFLDAFDEDTKAITNHGARIREMMEKCREFSRVLITCRTQFFPKEEEVPGKTGIAKFGDRSAGDAGEYVFRKLYIQPLSDRQVDQYLRKRYRFWSWENRQKAKELVGRVPNLKFRPMLLSYIPEILKKNVQINSDYELYEVLVASWIEREKRFIPDSEALERFSKKLAWDLHRNREKRGAERIPHEELLALKGAWELPLERWQMRNRSLLNRDAEGNYKFAHRSIMEFLSVQHFLSLPGEKRSSIEWTDQMKFFLGERILMENGIKELSCVDLSNIDLKDADLNKTDLSGANLNGANLSGANLNGANLSGTNLSSADLNQANLSKAVLGGANLSRANLSGVNLCDTDLSGASLSSTDLNQANLNGANLIGVNLSEVDLSGANLCDTDLSSASLSSTDLNQANLSGANLIGVNLSEVDLSGANLCDTDLSGASLSSTDLNQADLSGANLIGVNLSGVDLSRVLRRPEWVEAGMNQNGIYSQERLTNAIKNGFKHLIRADLRGVSLSKMDLSGADLSGADLSGADLSGADLSGADLSEADLTGANLDRVNLSNANLSGTFGTSEWVEWVKAWIDESGVYSQDYLIAAIKNGFKNLSKTYLSGADLSEADLSGADLNGADLSGADLNGADLSGAIGIPDWMEAGMNESGIYSQDYLIAAIIKNGYKSLSLADLSGADLRGVNLCWADLYEVNLSGADLSRANLNRASLSRANLYRTNLSGACLSGAYLKGAYLNEANLSGVRLRDDDQSLRRRGESLSRFELRWERTRTDLRGVDLSGANLTGSKGIPEWVKAGMDETGIYSQKLLMTAVKNGFKNLSEAYLRKVDLRGTDLSGVDLSKADLEETVLIGVILRGANLSDVNLRWANLNKAKLDGADLSCSKLFGADLGEGDLSKAELRDAELIDVDLSEANLSGVDLCQADLRGASLNRANLCGANLRGASLIGADLSEANLIGADLSEANLSKVKSAPGWVKAGMNESGVYSQDYLIAAIEKGFKNLSGADLRGANLSGVDLRGANLSGADLREANLSGANLYGANLSRVDLYETNMVNAFLRDASLSGVDLTRAKLKGADLSKACYSNNTQFKKHFDPRKHGMIKTL